MRKLSEFLNKFHPSGLVDKDYFNNSTFVELTYSELLALVVASSLIVGAKYLISDYQTVHTIPNTTETNTATIEPLLVSAIDINLLSPVAYSPSFPEDVIYYDYDNNQSIVPGCTKGYIYRRIDTVKNIDVGFDWRTVKFRRWKLDFTTVDTDGNDANYTKGQIVKKTSTDELYVKLNDETAKLFTDTSAWQLFEWENSKYVSPVSENWHLPSSSFTVTPELSTDYFDFTLFSSAPTTAATNTMDSSNILNVFIPKAENILLNSVFFGSTIKDIKIGINFYNNSLSDNFYSNIIGNGFANNSIGSDFYSCKIGDSFEHNIIGNDFALNTIGDSFSNNIIGAQFNSNNIINSFQNNSIGTSFQNNSIGNSFEINTIGINFKDNIIGTSFNNNTIGIEFYKNHVGSNYSHNTIGTYFYENIVGANFLYNTVGNFCNFNTFGNDFGNQVMPVTIGNNFMINIIPPGFFRSANGIDLSSSSVCSNPATKFWFYTTGGTVRLYYFANSTFAQVVSEVTA